MPTTQDIVQKLWNLCNILKDDGVTYQAYVTELTFLLFLKMAQETGIQNTLPKNYRWADLETKNEAEMLTYYRGLLLHLGTESKDKRVLAIFANAATSIRHPRHLRELVTQIDAIDWFEAREEGTLSDLYEGLLEKNASETKSGAGQYFTPRPLIDSMVAVVKPQPGEIIQDPAAGTLGFIVAADRYIKKNTNDLSKLKTAEQDFQIKQAYQAVELVLDTHRHALMNAMLHGIQSPVHLGDTLGSVGEHLPKANVILTNPPFGTKKGGGLPTRTDFTYQTSNKQFCFLQHIYRGLLPSGRAAVVLPDNVLFEENTGAEIRADLMDKCDLHTILRLPTGIFYAQGVKTNVLFFTRGKTDHGNTKQVWVYDLRGNMPSFGKRTPLTRDHFKPFEKAYGTDPLGKGKRTDEGETGRFRCFTREFIKARGENLDITWLKDDDAPNNKDLPKPKEAITNILKKLRAAVDEIQSLDHALPHPINTKSAKKKSAGGTTTANILPSGWELVKLRDIADVIMGQAPPGNDCNKLGKGTPFVKAGEFREERPIIREWTTNPLRMAEETDVLICVVGATCGKINLGIKAAIGRSVAAIRPRIPELQRIIYLQLIPRVFELRSASTGSAQGVLQRNQLLDLDFALPPFAEQSRIITSLTSAFARLNATKETLAAAAVEQGRLDQSLLAHAFTGQLVPQNPHDEPAEKLLERLKHREK